MRILNVQLSLTRRVASHRLETEKYAAIDSPSYWNFKSRFLCREEKPGWENSFVGLSVIARFILELSSGGKYY